MRLVIAIFFTTVLSQIHAADSKNAESSAWESNRAESGEKPEVLPEAGDFEGLDKNYSRQRTQNYSGRDRKNRDFELYDPRYDDGHDSSSGQ